MSKHRSDLIVTMFHIEASSMLVLFILSLMNTCGDSQLIGEERRYVFLEQAVLERVKSTLLEMMKNLESNLECRLEEKVERLKKEFSFLKSSNVKTGATNGCPSSGFCAVNGLVCPRFHMDLATLHRWLYMSKDNLTLFNGGQDKTDNLIKGTDKTRVYKGVQGSSPITNTKKVYFEVEVYYRIKEGFKDRYLLFEVGFAIEGNINKSHCVCGQPSVWSIHAARDPQTNKVFLNISNTGIYAKVAELSDNRPGTEVNLTLGFYVNRVDRVITVFDINMNSKVYTFTDIDGDQDLWPVFSVYNSHIVSVHLRLNTQKDISSYPCGL